MNNDMAAVCIISSGTDNVRCTIRFLLTGIFWPKLTHPAAWFVCDSWPTCSLISFRYIHALSCVPYTCWFCGCSRLGTVRTRSTNSIVSSQPSTVVLVRRLPACLWHSTPSPVIQFTVVCRSTCTQHVWWPVLCHCRAAGLELWAGWTATM